MNIIKDLNSEVPDTNAYYFRLDELSDSSSKDNLYTGYNSIHTNFMDGERQVVLNVWMPTEFGQHQDHFGNNSVEYNKNATEVYGVCPFTTEWLNEIDSEREYRYIFYPLNKKDIPPVMTKKYDACYFGGIHSPLHWDCLDVIETFNYRYMSMSHSINFMTQRNLYRATDIDLTHLQKLDVLSECRISICYNIVPVGESHVKNIKDIHGWEKNTAFSKLDSIGFLPQFKSRMHEAAISKTLNLVFKDPWRIAEDYYTSNEDFLYFESNDELGDIIQDVIDNYERYEKMIESAYNKVSNYSTEKMFDVIKKGKKCKSIVVDRVVQNA